MFDNLNGAKLASKRLKARFSLSAAHAQEIVARAAGYQNWHQLTKIIGTSSAPQTLGSGAVLSEYAKTHSILENIDLQSLWNEIEPTQGRQSYRVAEDMAYDAQTAFEHGDLSEGKIRLRRALAVDPFCTHALLMSAASIPDVEARIPLYWDALKGASRFVVSDQNNFIGRLKAGLSTLCKAEEDYGEFNNESELDADGPNKAATAATNIWMDEGFRDRWSEIEMRDYLRSLFCLGEALLRCNRPSEAAIMLREFASQSPSNHFDSLLWLSSAHIALGQIDEAQKVAETYNAANTEWSSIVRSICQIARGDSNAKEQLLKDESRFCSILSTLLAQGDDPGPDADQNTDHSQFECARALSHGIRQYPPLYEAWIPATSQTPEPRPSLPTDR